MTTFITSTSKIESFNYSTSIRKLLYLAIFTNFLSETPSLHFMYFFFFVYHNLYVSHQCFFYQLFISVSSLYIIICLCYIKFVLYYISIYFISVLAYLMLVLIILYQFVFFLYKFSLLFQYYYLFILYQCLFYYFLY